MPSTQPFAIGLLVFGSTACASTPLREPDASTPPPRTNEGVGLWPGSDAALAACAGRWISRRPKSVVGRGGDDVLVISRGSDGWTIRFDSVFHPGVVHPGTMTHTRGRETTVRASEDRLRWTAEPRGDGLARDVESTYRLESDRLVLPAWIRRDARTWRYAHDGDAYEIGLDHDPHLQREGGASLVGSWTFPAPVYYSAFVRESNATNCPDMFVTRLWRRSTTGEVVELGELVEDPYWFAWFQPAQASAIAERRWERLSDAEWQKIEALPESATTPPR